MPLSFLWTPESFPRNLQCPQSPSSSRLSITFCLAEKTSSKMRHISALFMELLWKSLAFTLCWFAVMNLYMPEHLAKRGKNNFPFSLISRNCDAEQGCNTELRFSWGARAIVWGRIQVLPVQHPPWGCASPMISRFPAAPASPSYLLPFTAWTHRMSVCPPRQVWRQVLEFKVRNTQERSSQDLPHDRNPRTEAEISTFFPCSQTGVEYLFARPGLFGCLSSGIALGACEAADTSRALLGMIPAEPGARCRGVRRRLRVRSLLTCRALAQRREIKSHLCKKPKEFCRGQR